MSVSITLLGRPAASDGDRTLPRPRGRKAWALLAYLLLTAQPPSRERLAELLFGEADDPLGALRWNLTELRRAMGGSLSIEGDPIRLALAPDCVVDATVIVRGTWMEAVRLPGLGRDLLEGFTLPDSAAIETWLLAERRRFAGISAAILREAATASLAVLDGRRAVDLASRLVAIEDFDEEAHALLVRAYVAAGDLARARRQAMASADYLRRELGVEPSAVLVRALEPPLDQADHPRGEARQARDRGPRATEALVEAGRVAVNAGAVDAGLETLRLAVAEAQARDDRGLAARAQLAYGIALVHGGRGRDGEGATWLHSALASAEQAGDHLVRGDACRELGYVDFLRARFDRAEAWLEQALVLAPDEAERGASLGVLGAVSSDRGRTGAAIETLREAARVGRAAAKPRVEAWATAFLGRAHLLRAELDLAASELDRASDLCRTVGWVSFAPWPQALRAEAYLLAGHTEIASDLFEAAFAVGCQIGDPCWEGMGARGIGLVHLKRGRIDQGIEWLDDARRRCIRIPDAYLWIHAYCLDALCAAGIAHERPEARSWIEDLATLAARTGMREMLVRSHLHRSALDGDPALQAARLFARDIDDPLLLGLLEPLAAARSG